MLPDACQRAWGELAVPCAAPHQRPRLKCKAQVYQHTIGGIPASDCQHESCQPAERAPSDQSENFIYSSSEDVTIIL